MNENLKDKELMLYAPYSSYETEENVMSEMNLQGVTVAADYDLTAEEDFITGKDFIADGILSSEEMNVENFENAGEYFEEEDELALDEELVEDEEDIFVDEGEI